MRLKFTIAAALMVSVAFVKLTHAQNQEAHTEKGSAPVRLAREFVESDETRGERTEVKEKTNVVIEEIYVDLETASVALQVVSWKHTDNSKEVVAVIPFMQAIDPEQIAKVIRGLTEEAPNTLNRTMAQAVYKDFGRDIYWSRHLKSLTADALGKFDRERFELAGFGSLKGRLIVDNDGDAIGKLVNLGIDEEDGTVVYCVVQSEDDSLRAIPMGAFVERDTKRSWKIELEREQVMLFEPFDSANPPQSIDRGWQEYVAVRYGRNSLQTETKGAINREKVIEQKSGERQSGKDK